MDMLMAWVMDNVIDTITGVVGSILFALIVPTMSLLITSLGIIFKSFAGMDSAYNVDKPEGALDTDGGMVYDLLNTSLIRKLILSIMILAGFLLIIFTVMAFLKNVYAQKQKTAKEIISNTLKGALYFIFVPVCTLLGVYLGNIVLKAVDGVTSPTGSSGNLGRRLFVTCAYNANHFRSKEFSTGMVENLRADATRWGYYRADEIVDGLTAEEYAFFVDDMFATTNYPLTPEQVIEFYHTIEFDYLTYIIGGCFMLYVLASLAFAMVRRVFIILIWFVISPACCAMFPLDEGKMVGKYKDEMTKQVLSAYGAVAGVNLFYSVMPLIDQIHFWGGNVLTSDFMGIIELFILVSGLLCVKEIVSSLSSLVGGEDALAKGSSLMKASTGAMKKYGGGAVKGVSKFTGEVAARYAHMRRLDDDGKPVHGKAASFWGALGTSVGLGAGFGAMKGLLGVDVKDIKKSYGDSKKAQEDEYAKKAANEWASSLIKSADDLKKWKDKLTESSEALAKFVKDFQYKGGSKDDAIKFASKITGTSSENINRRLDKFEKDKSTLATSEAQNMPGILAAQSRFANTNAAMEAALGGFAGIDSITYDRRKHGSNQKEAVNAYNEALELANKGQFAEAAKRLEGVNPGTLKGKDAELFAALSGELNKVNATSVESDAKAAINEIVTLARSAASSVEKVEGDNKTNIENAADAIAALANNFSGAGNTMKDQISTIAKNLNGVVKNPPSKTP